MLARQVATLDILSGGRAELGLGAGAFWDAIEAMGGPRRSPGESVAALPEAIGVIRALWTPGRGARLTGDHYSLHGPQPGPFPLHAIPISPAPHHYPIPPPTPQFPTHALPP